MRRKTQDVDLAQRRLVLPVVLTVHRGRAGREWTTDRTLKIEKNSRNVLTVRFDDVHEGFEHWFLLSADRHHYSRDCNRDLELEHLDMVKKRGGHIFDFGDIFDAMQGKYDPRRSYPEMRKEYIAMMDDENIGYLDVIVKDAIEFYK